MSCTELTAKQKLFVAAYAQTLNATESARLAGYAGNDVTMGAVGADNLKKPLIAAAVKASIAARTAQMKMSADDVLKRLADHEFLKTSPRLLLILCAFW